MTKDEVLKLALEALESKDTWGSSVRVLKERAVTSLRTALSASKIEGDLIQRFYEGEEAKSLISEAEETITALREALAEQPAQPEQEPVAWGMMNDDGKIYDCICPEEHDRVEGEYTIPLYTSPPQRKPLPSWIAYDEQQDVLTIHGRRYSAGLFDERGFGSPPGTLLRIVDGPSYVVTLERVAEQPAQQQEPVADECDSPEICRVARQCCGQYGTKNLCASTPPPRKPLTDEEIETLWQNTSPYYDHQDFARAIEAAHGIKEKNT